MTIIGWAYNERDKNAAHKDKEYIPDNIINPILNMQKAVSYVQTYMQDILPDKLPEIEYYSYDPLLFRYIHGITPELEKEYVIKQRLYAYMYFSSPLHQDITAKLYTSIGSKLYVNKEIKLVNEPESARKYRCTNDVGVMMQGGTVGDYVGSLYKRQDGCLNVNALYDDCNMWVTLDNKEPDKENDTFLHLINLLRQEHCEE